MANNEQLVRLKAGVATWNTWMNENVSREFREDIDYPGEGEWITVLREEIDLSGADLSNANLSGVNL